MEIIFEIDRFGGLEHRCLPYSRRRWPKDIVYHVRRVAPYGQDWELVKAISKRIVFRRGREMSVVTYAIED